MRDPLNIKELTKTTNPVINTAVVLVLLLIILALVSWMLD